MSEAPQTKVNLFDVETQRCPYDAYKTLRDEAPVYQCPTTGMYVITRFDDVRQILTDTEHFTNETAYLTDATEPSPPCAGGPQHLPRGRLGARQNAQRPR